MEWMRKDFDPQTREKAAGETRVIIMDGHSSHYTADLLEYCIANNIEILGYPPHCTHALQGLDVVCFAKMKEIWKEEISAFETLHTRGVNKEDFCFVWGKAFLRAFTPETVKAAFSATGIHPYSANVITPEQMRPSESTSTKASFPLPQSSPVRAVMAALGGYSFTRQNMHPDSPTRSIDIDPTLLTPTRPPRRPIDPASDPDQATPSKRMRFFAAGMACTSGSFLLEKTRATHLQMTQIIKPPIIEHPPVNLESPDWSLLGLAKPSSFYSRSELEGRMEGLTENLHRAKGVISAYKVINEGANSQMILQHMVLDKLNQSLHEKEKGKKSDRTILFPGGKGRHLTDAEVIKLKRELEDDKEREEARKEARKTKKDQRRVEKERVEVEWKKIVEEHGHAVEDWETKCRELKEKGVRVKDLPKKPKRAPKPKPIEMVADSEDEEDEESNGEDGMGDEMA